MKGRVVALVCALAFPLAIVATATPAAASTTGVIVFAGTVTLPAFPCNACAATFTSTVAAGAYGSTPVTRVSAAVSYTDTCVAGQPVSGVADSTSFVEINTPATPTGIRIHWVRTGLVTIINTGAGSLDSVSGVAVFAPTSVPSCASPGAVTALLAGAVVTA